MMYVFVSSTVKAAAQEFGLTKRIEEVKERLEADPSLLTPIFESRFPCWIKKMENFRLIAAKPRSFGEDQVLYLADILKRGCTEYHPEFLDDPKKWEKKQNIDWKTVSKWLEERKRREEQEQHKRNIQPHVPDYLLTWLNHPTLTKEQDIVVYESEKWVGFFNSKNERKIKKLECFYNLTYQIIGEGELGYQPDTSIKNVHAYTDQKTKYTVLFSRIRPHDEPQRTIVFFIAALEHKPTSTEIKEIGQDLDLFGYNTTYNTTHNQGSFNVFINILDNKKITTNEIARYSRRAYPGEIASSFENWEKIELDDRINMAMSAEEENLLHSIQFPAFINGRAGSGKSTMLHYAFAYYCEEYLKQVTNKALSPEKQQELRPLFLTYSDSLSMEARKTVLLILRRHHQYGGETLQVTADHNLLNSCFQTFQTFLLNCLKNERIEDFSLSKYLSFNEFKKWYKKSYPQEQYSAEICWHVIRTYIKGYHCDDGEQDFLDFEDYQNEVRTNHKTVSDDDFQEIFNTVWKGYQRFCKKEKYWDDQDLARTVLAEIVNGEIQPPLYAATFCDEAQDFTRIEFQLILRLSVWLKYQLPHSIESLPFAFAGDPLQTLNPTGFNWTSFCASFYENIVLPLDPEETRGLRKHNEWKPEELKQNYRSSTPIVKFTNVVNLWRATLFNLHDLEPQLPWWLDTGRQPEKGICSHGRLDIEDLKKLYETQKTTTFLLPCDEGGELDFIQGDSILKRVISIEDDKVPNNVYTAAGLKGLELSSVIVCWFGEYYANEFNRIRLDPINTEVASLKLEYFLNKLYVAVSRSTKFLGIIDTQIGDDLLWDNAADKNDFHIWLKQTKIAKRKAQAWIDNLNTLSSRFKLENIETDSRSDAKKWLLSGCDNKDIRHLKTAIDFYRDIQMHNEVHYCKAWILRLNGQLQEAGNAFMDLPDLQEQDLDPKADAWQCFWEAGLWQDLESWIAQNPDISEALMEPVVKFMLHDFAIAEVNDISRYLCDHVDEIGIQCCQNATWKSVLTRYQDAVRYFIDHSETPKTKDWQLWCETIQTIASTELVNNEISELAGYCAYYAKDFEQAINQWDKSGNIKHQKYGASKAECASFPGNIHLFVEAQLFDHAIKIWEDHGSKYDGNCSTVLPDLRKALKELDKIENLLKLEIDIRDWQNAANLCNQEHLGIVDRLNIVRCIAYDSQWKPPASKNGKKEMSDFIEAITTHSDWDSTQLPIWQSEYEKNLEACVALEKTGDFETSLKVLEGFINQSYLPGNLSTFIKERWLAVKEKQAKSSKGGGTGAKIRRERNRQANEWGIEWHNLSPKVPTLPLSNQEFILSPDIVAVEIPKELEQLRQDIEEILLGLSQHELQNVKHYLTYLLYLRREDIGI
jgi:hypothetical protein